MSANENATGTWTAPYASWRTLQNTVERMKNDGGVPGRLDRSYLSNLPGSAQSELQTTMKALGLINDQMEPTALLGRLVEDDGGRPAIVKEILESRYAGPLALGLNATQAQLETEFRTKLGVQGSTLRKAVRFYLNAAAFAGVPLSQHFKSPSATEPGERRQRRPKTVAKQQPPAEVKPETPKVTSGLHPFIEGLVATLPKPGEPFSNDKQDAWFDTARGVFRLIYTTGGTSAAKPSTPATGDGEND